MGQDFPYFDRSLGVVVNNERQREAAMKVKRLIDARDFTSVESVESEAARKLRERIQNRDAYLRDPIARAIHQAENEYDEEVILRELKYNLVNGRMASEYEQQRFEEKAIHGS